MNKPKRALTIAGSAARGTAGIQADLKTFQELDVYGMSVVTALVATHPETKQGIFEQSIDAIEAQFFTSKTEVGIDALKTGMLFSKGIIDKVSELLEHVPQRKIIVDPVMVGKMGSKLLRDDAIEALRDKIIPKASLITPNLEEASILLNNRPINSINEMKQAALDLHTHGVPAVLVKGGRLQGPAKDVLFDGENLFILTAPRIKTKNTNGAGCTYAAAITANIAKGEGIFEAVRHAKQFVTTAIEHSFSYTDIVGPTYHAAERNYGQAHEIRIEKMEDNR